jgi:hypothetical protein
MVKTDQIGTIVTSPPLTLDPPVVGEARWVNDSTLEFVATTTLPLSTRFVATVPAGTRALDGHQLASAFSFEFFTERLSGEVELLDSQTRAGREPMVKLSFSQDVPLASIEKGCRYSDGKQSHPARRGPDSEAGPGRNYTVIPAAPLTANTSWTFSCAPIAGAVGNLGPVAALERFTYGPFSFVESADGTDVVPDDDAAPARVH